MKTEAIERLIRSHEIDVERWAYLLESEKADLSLAIEARTELAAVEAERTSVVVELTRLFGPAKEHHGLTWFGSMIARIGETLTALEADNARKDGVLRYVITLGTGVGQLTHAIAHAEAALTSSPAGAFVSLEQLRLIHRIVKMQQSLLSYWHHRGDTNCEESITIAHRDVSIDSERLIYSLDAKIKEAEDA